MPLLNCRVDNNLQELREKLFPFNSKRNEVLMTAKRKERSICSLAPNNATTTSDQSRMTRSIKYPAHMNVILREPILTREDSLIENNISSIEHTRNTSINAMKVTETNSLFVCPLKLCQSASNDF